MSIWGISIWGSSLFPGAHGANAECAAKSEAEIWIRPNANRHFCLKADTVRPQNNATIVSPSPRWPLPKMNAATVETLEIIAIIMAKRLKRRART